MQVAECGQCHFAVDGNLEESLAFRAANEENNLSIHLLILPTFLESVYCLFLLTSYLVPCNKAYQWPKAEAEEIRVDVNF